MEQDTLIAFNVWDADEYGDGERTGMVLTAYPHTEEDGVDTSQYISVSISREDLVSLGCEDADDAWFYPSNPYDVERYEILMQLFINKIIEENQSGTR